jgi:hypothetical protein
MPLSGGNRTYDAYGHPNDAFANQNSGFSVSASSAVAGTIYNPGTADPTGSTNLVSPFVVSDAYGQFQITTAGSQTTGALRTIYFSQPYQMVRPVLAVVTVASSGAAAGGTLTVTMTTTSLALSIGTGLTVSTTYSISYVIL